MKNCLESKKKNPHLIAGYDLVGQEDKGRSLKDHAPELIWFSEQCQKYNLEIPFFFHAGETLGDGTAADNNLFDAILFQSRRVGHGFSLYKHPQLMREYKDNHILVESCPISNEALRLTTDILHHPLPALIAHGVPTALSNDDPNVEGQDAAGLSFDFYEAIQGFDNLGLAGLVSLSFFSDGDLVLRCGGCSGSE
jgi:adenosine deaminase CECR1